MNKTLVKSFIQKVPRIKDCSIQTFDDLASRSDKALATILPFDKGRSNQVVELQKKGAGAFWSVNPMKRGCRNKDSVTAIKVRICEVDNVSKQKQLEMYANCPLKPTMLIESNKSYHAYWYAVDGDKETYSQICGGLRDYFDGDVKLVSDYSRVLRIPGFNHLKNPDVPFLVNIHSFDGSRRYTKIQMIEAYPKKEKSEDKVVYEPKNTEDFWEEITSWGNKEMLLDIAGTSLVDGQTFDFKRNASGTEQIRVNGTSSSCWIDRQGMIGSNDKGGPTRVQWVMYYNNVTKSELYHWVIDKYEHKLPKKVVQNIQNKQRAKEVKESITKEQVQENFQHIMYGDKIDMGLSELMSTNPKQVIKRGWEEFDTKFGGVYTGKIYLIGAETGTGKSTFCNMVCDNIAKQGHQVVRYSLEDRVEDKAIEDIFYATNKIRSENGLDELERVHFLNNEYGHPQGKYYDEGHWEIVQMAVESIKRVPIKELKKKKKINIKELATLIEEAVMEGSRFFLIDHLHYFEMSNGQRRDLEIEDVMQELNDLVRNYNIALFLVAHYNNKQPKDGIPHPGQFKDGSAIKQVANIIIQIVQDEDVTGKTYFYVTKKRGPGYVRKITGIFDTRSHTYSFTRTQEQKEKDEEFDALNLSFDDIV